MSQLVEMFQKSAKTRVVEARAIPGQAVNYFDRENNFQDGWTNNQRRGDATAWTENALQYYNTELSQMLIPESFVRHDQDIPLNRWNPKQRYYEPGRGQGS